jgi:hypothetical protein
MRASTFRATCGQKGSIMSPITRAAAIQGVSHMSGPRPPRDLIRTARSPTMLRGRCGCKAVCYEVADEFVVAYTAIARVVAQ